MNSILDSSLHERFRRQYGQAEVWELRLYDVLRSVFA